MQYLKRPALDLVIMRTDAASLISLADSRSSNAMSLSSRSPRTSSVKLDQLVRHVSPVHHANQNQTANNTAAVTQAMISRRSSSDISRGPMLQSGQRATDRGLKHQKVGGGKRGGGMSMLT
jgi:hypothetical protein